MPYTLLARSVHSGEALRLRVLSYNIHAGVEARRYRHYLTRGWRHVVPHARRWRTLDALAPLLAPFDLVALQETDGGSFRTGFESPTRYLARAARFPYWFDQVNRQVGTLALHGLGLLARLAPFEVAQHALPGLRGRGALVALFGDRRDPLVVVCAHLALGRRARLRQVEYLCELVAGRSRVLLMGDLNCAPGSAELDRLTSRTGLRLVGPGQGGTYPSWEPWRRLDHVLVSPALEIEGCQVPRWTHSDHLPVAAEVLLPGGL